MNLGNQERRTVALPHEEKILAEACFLDLTTTSLGFKVPGFTLKCIAWNVQLVQKAKLYVAKDMVGGAGSSAGTTHKIAAQSKMSALLCEQATMHPTQNNTEAQQHCSDTTSKQVAPHTCRRRGNVLLLLPPNVGTYTIPEFSVPRINAQKLRPLYGRAAVKPQHVANKTSAHSQAEFQ